MGIRALRVLLRGRNLVFVLVMTAALMIRTSSAKYGTMANFAGPYISYVDRAYMCPGAENDDRIKWRWYLRLTHFNPLNPTALQRITGNQTGTSPIGDKDALRVIMDTRSNNQWKENAFIFDFQRGACSTMRTYLPDIYRTLHKQDPTSSAPCQLEPGVFKYENETISWVVRSFPIMPYGHYRYRFMIRPVVCYMLEMHIIPKTQSS